MLANPITTRMGVIILSFPHTRKCRLVHLLAGIKDQPASDEADRASTTRNHFINRNLHWPRDEVTEIVFFSSSDSIRDPKIISLGHPVNKIDAPAQCPIAFFASRPPTPKVSTSQLKQASEISFRM